MRACWSLLLRLGGWTIIGSFPYHLKKCIVIVGPHTSNWDFILGIAVRSKLKLQHFTFLGKKELFDGPFGFIFRKLGGVPVDRSGQHNMVDQVTDYFNKNEYFSLVLSPEGTRKKVERIHKGFYFIAKNAGVPIVMTAFDFEHKQLVLAAPFLPGNDEASDFEHIYRFFGPVKGKIPAQGMAHLLTETSSILL